MIYTLVTRVDWETSEMDKNQYFEQTVKIVDEEKHHD